MEGERRYPASGAAATASELHLVRFFLPFPYGPMDSSLPQDCIFDSLQYRDLIQWLLFFHLCFVTWYASRSRIHLPCCLWVDAPRLVFAGNWTSGFFLVLTGGWWFLGWYGEEQFLSWQSSPLRIMGFMYSLHPYLLSSMAAWIVRFLWDLFIELAAAFCCSITAVCIVLKFALVVNWFFELLICLLISWWNCFWSYRLQSSSPHPIT
jgi:hypothetical protein